MTVTIVTEWTLHLYSNDIKLHVISLTHINTLYIDIVERMCDVAYVVLVKCLQQ